MIPKGAGMDGLHSRKTLTDLGGRRVLSLPATNSLAFLEAAFECWRQGRLFSVTRDPAALDGLGLSVETLSAPLDETGGWGAFEHRPNLSDDPAQIVFSSGTEGRPKAILLSHRNLADVVMRLNAAMGVTSEIREYVGVPVTYSFGLGRARAVAAAGGRIFLPERFDPAQIREMLAAGQINAISAVPSLWRMVLAHPGVIGDQGGKVRWIEIGSQYMSAADKLALRELFPQACILQHYGLTEASRTTFLNISTAPEAALESVGEASGSVQLRIVRDGAIAIRGDHVALGQIVEGGHLRPLTDAQGWLVTRDRGEIRDGRLYYLGRLDDQINLAGIKIAAEGLEAEIRALLPWVGDHVAVAPIPDPARGEAVLLAIETCLADRGGLIETAARMALTRRGVAVGQGPGSALAVLHLEALPRTGTAKIQRRLLPDLWRERSGAGIAPPDPSPAPGAAADLDPDQARLARSWSRVIGQVDFAPDTSFYDAGGDSLSSVQIGLVMESEGLPRAVIRATLEGRSLREAAALMPAAENAGSAEVAQLPDAAQRSWAITMTRAVMALSVLLSHWGPGFFGRLGLADQAEGALSLLYRMGTPGFAAVFGIGIGYFMLPGYGSKRASVLRRLDSAFWLVVLGMVLLAAVKLGNLAVRGQPIGGLQVAHGFYSVLGYYALMLGTARWWLGPLSRISRPIPWLLAGLPILWLAWKFVPQILPQQQFNSFLEWPRLMLVGGYNVFKMTAVAAGGMAVGLWLAAQADTARTARDLTVAGLFGVALALMSLIEAYGIAAFQNRENGVFLSLPGLILYLSLAMAMTGIFLILLTIWDRLPRLPRVILQLLVVIGGLALPIYVFHGAVMPARDLLEGLGLPGAPALVLPLGAFLAVMGYSGRRLWRMYFG